jgi:uncharacterized membrane protein YkvA (DUF1232 family)
VAAGRACPIIGAGAGRDRAVLRRRRVTITSVSALQWFLVLAGAVLSLYTAFLLWLVRGGRREQAVALARLIPDCAVLFRRLLADERTPRNTKLLLVALVGYLLMPLDLVPDFIPVAGQLDDAILVALVLRRLFHATGPDVLSEHWPGPPATLSVLLRVAGQPAC